MKVLSLMNEKGGAGKSTLSIAIACGLQQRGHKVVIVDCDAQRSVSTWREIAGEESDLPLVIGLDQATLKSGLKTLDADFVVIDTPARAEKLSATVIGVSDIVLIPVQPSGFDIWAAETIVAMIEQRIELGGEVQAGFVLNRLQENRNLDKEAKTGGWNEYSIPVLDTIIPERQDFKTSATEGTSVYKLPSDAKKRIDALLNEILGD